MPHGSSHGGKDHAAAAGTPSGSTPIDGTAKPLDGASSHLVIHLVVHLVLMLMAPDAHTALDPGG